MYDRIHPYPFVLFIWKITVLHVFIADFTYQSIHIVLSLPHLLLLFYTNTPILTQLQAFLTIPDRPCPFIPPHLNVIPYHKSLRVMPTTSNLGVQTALPNWIKCVCRTHTKESNKEPCKRDFLVVYIFLSMCGKSAFNHIVPQYWDFFLFVFCDRKTLR